MDFEGLKAAIASLVNFIRKIAAMLGIELPQHPVDPVE